jgi:DNA-binding response OmpR family regulator
VSPDEVLASPIDAPRATIVVAVMSEAAERVVAALRRDSLEIDLATADVLRATAAPIVYVFWFEAALGVVLAERIVTWANACELRAGLIGVIEDGGGDEREALLAAGFDDVVAGQLSPRELGARIRAVHRRMHWSGRTGRLRYAGLTLDLDNHTLWADGRTISLTSIELAVMRELIKAAGKPLSRAALLDAAWGAGELEISERAVDNVILRLRRKLPRPEALETVRSIGFRLTT